MNDLTPRQVINWFRHHADRFNRIADELERVCHGSDMGAKLSNMATPEQVIERLKVKSGRVKDLAAHFGVYPDAIRMAIAGANGEIYSAGRGWFKVKEKPQDEPNTGAAIGSPEIQENVTETT